MTDEGHKPSRSIVQDGVVAGLVGAGLVAAWFFALDTVREEAFYTPSLLATVVFDGGTPETVVIDAKNVFAYSGLHVMLFLVAGWCLAWAVREFDDSPHFGLIYLLCYVMIVAIVFGLQIAMMPEVLGAIGTWAVAVGNLLAAIGMFWFLVRRHPSSIKNLREAWHD